MQILELTTENIKRISAVHITPTGPLVVLGGKNGQGKSSVLDSIEMALGGGEMPAMPVRQGEDSARIVLDLGDIVVKRTFTAAGGTSLVVTNKDGVKQASPQAILDKLLGTLTFDPLEFATQRPLVQSETLRKLVGLDFTEQRAAIENFFAFRSIVNREAKSLEARMTSMPQYPDAPGAEQSIAGLSEEQRKASDFNSANVAKRASAKAAADDRDKCRWTLDTTKREIKDCEEKLQALRDSLPEKEANFYSAETAYIAAKATADIAIDIDLKQFSQKLADAETNNAKVRANIERAKVVENYKAKTAESEGLTAKMAALEAEMRTATNAAKWPIDGLGFSTSGGVTLNGIPFDQSSTADQLRVSIAIGLALNPALRVLLIRSGSMLDEDSMAVVKEMATAANAQIWIERVGVDASTSVVISDGRVA